VVHEVHRKDAEGAETYAERSYQRSSGLSLSVSAFSAFSAVNPDYVTS